MMVRCPVTRRAQGPIHPVALGDQFVPDQLLTSYRIGCSNRSGRCTNQVRTGGRRADSSTASAANKVHAGSWKRQLDHAKLAKGAKKPCFEHLEVVKKP